jgi:lipopolysaccharide transport system ATP-binding protein
MQMRLAFDIAAHTEPDTLLVDEVLAVGDLAFQSKCLDRILELKARGCTIFFVSHDVAMVRRVCDSVLWLRDGRLAASGDTNTLLDEYVAAVAPDPGSSSGGEAVGRQIGAP